MQRVLVISEQLQARLTSSELLKSVGFDSIYTTGYEGAAALVDKLDPQFLFVDAGIYENRGLDWIEKLRRDTGKRLPAILLSCRDSGQRYFLQERLLDGRIVEGPPAKLEIVKAAMQELLQDPIVQLPPQPGALLQHP